MHSHPMNEARHQLESLLRETPAKARVRQQGAFDEVARGSPPDRKFWARADWAAAPSGFCKELISKC